jgi:hypothetical protein
MAGKEKKNFEKHVLDFIMQPLTNFCFVNLYFLYKKSKALQPILVHKQECIYLLYELYSVYHSYCFLARHQQELQ